MSNESKLFAAIAEVAKELSEHGIRKDRKNDAQNFYFRGVDDVLNVLSPLLAKHRLIVIPTYGEPKYTTQEKTVTKGNDTKTSVTRFVSLMGTFKIVSLEDGSSIEAGPFPGEAMDTADKATNKAMSASYKYFAIQTFAIPVVGLDDSDADEDQDAEHAQPAVDPKKWIAEINGATTREQVLKLAEDAKKLCAEVGDADAWMAIKAARDARGKALASKPAANQQPAKEAA